MPSIRARLSLMMFLEYFVWGAWGVQMGGYMAGRGFTGLEIGSVYSTTAIAAIFSPLLMGYIADRLFSTEKLLAVLHLLGAVLLAAAAMSATIVDQLPIETTESMVLFVIMLVYSLCYMPTLALTNSISFDNIESPEKDFPLIRVFGTLGWIAAGLIVGFILQASPDSFTYPLVTSVVGVDSPLLQSNNFIYLAAVSSAALGLFSFMLPHTPPKTAAAEQTLGAEGRQGILSLLGEPSFLVFVIASFLVCIPLAFYYSFANAFLAQTDAPYPTALQTIGQISEVFFMAIMPWFILRLGVKKMLAVGMLAWVARYVLFAMFDTPALGFSLVVLGLLLHGICYDFFFVASQIYVDKKADIAQRARAQSFIAFVTLGLGMFVGAYVGGYTYDQYPPRIQVAATATDGSAADIPEETTTPLPEWETLAEADQATLAPGDLPAVHSVAAADGSTLTYDRDALAAGMTEADRDGDGSVSRPEWRLAQAYDWIYIWLWPAAAAGATLLFFWFGFRDEVKVDDVV